MKKVKIKNELKKPYAECIKERMGEYYEQKPFKIHTKRKKDNYSQILDVINQNNENVKRKKSNESTNNDS